MHCRYRPSTISFERESIERHASPGQYRVFTDLLSVDRDIVSVSDGSADLKTQTFAFDGTRPVEIRITIAR